MRVRVRTEARLLEHLHRLLTLAGVANEVYLVENDLEAAERRHGGDTDFGVEALGEAEVSENRAQRRRQNDEEPAALRWSTREQNQQGLQDGIREPWSDGREICSL